MSTILHKEIKQIQFEITLNQGFKTDYIQDLYVYGAIASGYFYSSEYQITPQQAADRVKTAERMIPHLQKQIDQLEARLNLLVKMTEAQEAA